MILCTHERVWWFESPSSTSFPRRPFDPFGKLRAGSSGATQGEVVLIIGYDYRGLRLRPAAGLSLGGAPGSWATESDTGLIRVWCEAVVQRLPDYFDPANDPVDSILAGDSLSALNETFGRRFRIVARVQVSQNYSRTLILVVPQGSIHDLDFQAFAFDESLSRFPANSLRLVNLSSRQLAVSAGGDKFTLAGNSERITSFNPSNGCIVDCHHSVP